MLSIGEVEAAISELVTLGQLHANIDRPQGQISFVRPSESEVEAIDEFGSRISHCSNSSDENCHMINKEIMQTQSIRQLNDSINAANRSMRLFHQQQLDGGLVGSAR